MKYDKMLEARRLRASEGLALNEISRRLGVAKSSVSNWVRNINLTNEQIQKLNEQNPLYNRAIDGGKAKSKYYRDLRKSYQQKGREKAKEKTWLHTTGCMLYWAEGSKGSTSVIFSNSDPEMMKLFLRFLQEEMLVNKNEIALSVNVHLNNELTLEQIEEYWIKELGLPAECLRKSTVSKLPRMSSGKKKNKLPYGVARICVCSVEILQHIFGAIQQYGNFVNEKWLR